VKKEDLEKIGQTMKKHDLDSWEVNKDLSIKESAAGSYQVFDGTGGQISLDRITEGQENEIRAMFKVKGGRMPCGKNEFDTNPLLDFDDDSSTVALKLRQQKDGKKNEFDTNPLLDD